MCMHCGYIAGTANFPEFMLQPQTGLWGRYIIGTILGIGGFGVTYRAFDTRLSRMVAIKEFFPQSLARRAPGDLTLRPFIGNTLDEFNIQKARFIAEGKSLIRFSNNQHIVNVLERFEDNGTAYIVMELLNGVTLKEHIEQKGGKLQKEEAEKILKQILLGVDAIHEGGVIHRDISPDNIFVTEDSNIKLLDFGAAKIEQKEEWTQSVVVKKGYAPPEQYRQNMRQSNVTDLYAVGATYYRMITGITPEESIQRWEKDTLQKPSKLIPKLSVADDKFVMKSLALKPEIRFSTAKSMLTALESGTGFDFPEKELTKRKIKHRALLFTAIIAIFAVLGIAGVRFSEAAATIAPGTSSLDTSVAPQELYFATSSISTDIGQSEYTNLVDEFNRSTPHTVHLIEYEPSELYFSADKFDITNMPFDGNYADLTPLLQTMYESNYYIIQDDYLTETSTGDGGYYSMPIGFKYTNYYIDKNVAEQPSTQLVSIDEVKQNHFDRGLLALDYSNIMHLAEIAYPPMFVDAVFTPDNVAPMITELYDLYTDVISSPDLAMFSTSRTSNIVFQESKNSNNIYVVEQDGVPVGVTTELYINDDISAAKKDAAMQFLDFCAGKKGQLILTVQNTSLLPVNRTAMEEYLQTYPAAEQYKNLFDLGLVVPDGTKNNYYLDVYGMDSIMDTVFRDHFDERTDVTTEEYVEAFYILDELAAAELQ